MKGYLKALQKFVKRLLSPTTPNAQHSFSSKNAVSPQNYSFYLLIAPRKVEGTFKVQFIRYLEEKLIPLVTH